MQYFSGNNQANSVCVGLVSRSTGTEPICCMENIGHVISRRKLVVIILTDLGYEKWCIIIVTNVWHYLHKLVPYIENTHFIGRFIGLCQKISSMILRGMDALGREVTVKNIFYLPCQ